MPSFATRNAAFQNAKGYLSLFPKDQIGIVVFNDFKDLKDFKDAKDLRSGGFAIRPHVQVEGDKEYSAVRGCAKTKPFQLQGHILVFVRQPTIGYQDVMNGQIQEYVPTGWKI